MSSSYDYSSSDDEWDLEEEEDIAMLWKDREGNLEGGE
jgi:hypothetical protein